MPKIKIIDVREEALHYLKSFQIDYLDKTGKKRCWELVSRGTKQRLLQEMKGERALSDGCMIVAQSEDKKRVVMVREFRIALNDYVYAFPAGLGEKGEEVKGIACREFKEETGLNFHYDGHDKARYTSIGLSNEIVYTVFGRYSGQLSTDFLEDSEDLEPLEVDRDTALHLLKEEVVTIRSAFLLLLLFQLPISTLYESSR